MSAYDPKQTLLAHSLDLDFQHDKIEVRAYSADLTLGTSGVGRKGGVYAPLTRIAVVGVCCLGT